MPPPSLIVSIRDISSILFLITAYWHCLASTFRPGSSRHGGDHGPVPKLWAGGLCNEEIDVPISLQLVSLLGLANQDNSDDDDDDDGPVS